MNRSNWFYTISLFAIGLAFHGVGLAQSAPAQAAPDSPSATDQPRAVRRTSVATSSTRSAAPAVAPEGVVNIQTATVEELQRLPGIGPSKAEAIVAFRTRTPFRRIEDVLRVRGIGRAMFRSMRDYIRVDGPTTLTRDLPRTPPSE